MVLFIFVVRRLFAGCGCVFRLMRYLLVSEFTFCLFWLLIWLGLLYLLLLRFCGRVNSVGGFVFDTFCFELWSEFGCVC